MLARVTAHLTRRAPSRSWGGVNQVIKAYQGPVEAQRTAGAALLTGAERRTFEILEQRLRESGAPEGLAREGALLRVLAPAVAISDLARAAEWSIESAALLYRAIGAVLGLDRARAASETLRLPSHFDRMALRRTLEDFDRDQRLLALRAAAEAERPETLEEAERIARAWLASQGDKAQPALRVVEEFETSGAWSLSKAMLASAEVHNLAGPG